MSSIGLKGLYTPPPPEDRDIAYLDVEHNGQLYDWLVYVPSGVNVGEYLDSKAESIYADIDAKEARWAALEPKTRTITDPITGESTTVDIPKEEIVKPNFPDYYALRRSEYPPLGEQLGALWKGVDSSDFAEMSKKILDIKAKYPKPGV